jgi:hypothetical protein
VKPFLKHRVLFYHFVYTVFQKGHTNGIPNVTETPCIQSGRTIHGVSVTFGIREAIFETPCIVLPLCIQTRVLYVERPVTRTDVYVFMQPVGLLSYLQPMFQLKS